MLFFASLISTTSFTFSTFAVLNVTRIVAFDTLLAFITFSLLLVLLVPAGIVSAVGASNFLQANSFVPTTLPSLSFTVIVHVLPWVKSGTFSIVYVVYPLLDLALG